MGAREDAREGVSLRWLTATVSHTSAQSPTARRYFCVIWVYTSITRHGGIMNNRFFMVVVAAAIGIGAIPIAMAAPASASVSCYGDYCSGQDPAATGCEADAVTIAAVQLDDGAGRVDLRWSPTCKTNWARWQQYPTGWCFNCAPLELLAVQDTGYTQKLDWFDAGTSPQAGGTYWTPMIYSPVHKVWAGVYMPCGAEGLVGSAVDCAQNGLVHTGAY